MRQRNNQWFPLLSALFLSISLAAQTQTSTQTAGQDKPSPSQSQSSAPQTQQPQTQQPQTTQNQDASGQQAPPQDQGGDQAPAEPAQNQPGDSVQVQGQGQQAESGGDGTFVFRTQVQETILYATVVDRGNKLVTALPKDAFVVYEDGQPQRITSFRSEDVPVSLGILVDNSGSMREHRPSVNQAAINLVRASNPDDEVFIVNYSDDAYLDQPFTANVSLLKEALERIESRGGTAMYDAIVASVKEAEKGKHDKKVLLVVTDGEDNASRDSLEQALERLRNEDAPTVYLIGILGSDKRAKRAKRAMSRIAQETGGVAFFPEDSTEVDAISRAIAHDIRNQYIIGYKPSNPQSRGGYRTVKVEARMKGYKDLNVRTRSGYYAGQDGKNQPSSQSTASAVVTQR